MEKGSSQKIETQKVEGHIKCKMLNQILLAAGLKLGPQVSEKLFFQQSP